MVAVHPGDLIPSDWTILDAFWKHDQGLPMLVVESDRFPAAWMPGFVMQSFLSIADVERYMAQATLEALR